MQSRLTSSYSFKKFDAFSKPIEDYKIKTFSGGIVSIVSAIIIVSLFLSELWAFLTPVVHQELFVDVSKDQKVPINIDITFPHLACEFISLDAMDISGSQQLDVDHEIYKIRLDKNLKEISPPIKQIVSNSTKSSPSSASPKSNENPEAEKKPKCGSCYGAETPDRQCCQSCHEVQVAYRARGWAIDDLSNIKQCQAEGLVGGGEGGGKSEAARAARRKALLTEGCRMHGTLRVNKVAGNFHIAPGKSYSASHVHVHDVQGLEIKKFNVTHFIRKISFGEDYPGIVNPLDNHQMTIQELNLMCSYYTKIVPTHYVKADGSAGLSTNQFSVTKHIKATALSGGSDGLPGLFFSYEFSPMMIRIREQYKPALHFLTDICAIIGGVFTVSSLIDALIYHGSHLLAVHKNS